jgi:5-formyltetrahydrofolate cyclo-ligase
VNVGICFDFQLVEKIPRELHDVPMDMVVTEREVLKIEK